MVGERAGIVMIMGMAEFPVIVRFLKN